MLVKSRVKRNFFRKPRPEHYALARRKMSKDQKSSLTLSLRPIYIYICKYAVLRQNGLPCYTRLTVLRFFVLFAFNARRGYAHMCVINCVCQRGEKGNCLQTAREWPYSRARLCVQSRGNVIVFAGHVPFSADQLKIRFVESFATFVTNSRMLMPS